jgi:tetratricopeptide (TPR) repeat protein
MTAGRYRLLAAGLTVVVAAGVLSARQTQGSREDAYRENNLGVARLEQYNYPDAVASFERALGIAGDLHVARLNLAIGLLYSGRPDEALAAARAAAERLPGVPQPHYVTGLAARALNDADVATAAFVQVLKLSPGDAGSNVNLGQIYLQQRAYDQAIARFREAVAAEPFNATAAYGLATALMRSGDAGGGREAMQRFEALREHPAAITYAQTYLEQGRFGEAIASTGAEPDLVDPAPPAVAFADATAGVVPATVVSAGEKGSPAGVTLIDVDGDGDLDAAIAGRVGLRLLINGGKAFTDGTARAGFDSGSPRPGRGAVSADYDNDGRPDLLLLGAAGARLYRQKDDGAFEDTTAASGIGGRTDAVASAAFADVDHDGDVDLLLLFAAGAPAQLLRNDGKGRFSDVTASAGLTDLATPIAVAPTDFDNRRDLDLLVLGSGAPRLYRNLRDGTFRDVAADVNLPGADSYTALAAADVDKDGYTDLLFARAGAPAVFARSDGGAPYTTVDGPAVAAGATVAQFVDYDNDGVLDLFTAGGGAPRLFRNTGRTWADVTDRAGLPSLGSQGDVVSAAFGDVDSDGDTDALVLLAGGDVRYWRNDGGNRNRSLAVRIEGRVSNRLGIGAKVEVRAGSLRQKIERSAAFPALGPADILFGLGARSQADVVRIIWPSGTLQAETASTLTPEPITELDRKPSSCPYLYTWNGTRFEFVTDFMGGGEIGYWQGPGRWNTPDPDEYVRIPPGMLVERDGRYELRVTNELEEALFVDRLQLVAVDHPEETHVYPYEGLGAPARDRFELMVSRGARPPLAARDEHGHDVLERLEAIDRRYPGDFAVLDIRGYAEPHDLVLDLGDGANRAALLATAWTDYAFSSDNIAAHHRGLALEPPSLEARTPGGAWRHVLDNVGIPVGRPQTVVIDLRGKLLAGEREVRIRTNMRIYWDQILVDTEGGGPVDVRRLDPLAADLRWRGFSAEISPDGRQPYAYDYDRVSPISPWKTMVGRYTREGDVRELLRGVDDMFVVSRPGDEIALAFEAGRLPPLGKGRARTFLLFAHGYSKEMDIGSATPHTVDPLPFRAMRAYPYGPDERYPDTAAHRGYRERYNTRIVSRPVPPIDAASERVSSSHQR